MRKIVTLFFLLLFASPVLAEDLYYRPGGPRGNNDGTSYADAWYRSSDISWGPGVGSVSEGDTLWCCGDDDGSGFEIIAANSLTVGGDGALGNHITIRNDCSTKNGAYKDGFFMRTVFQDIDISDWTADGNRFWIACSAMFAQAAFYKDGAEGAWHRVANRAEGEPAANDTFWVDTENNKLWWYPKTGFVPDENTRFNLASNEDTIAVVNHDYVTFQFMTVMGGDRGFAIVNDSDHISILDSTIKWISSYAVAIGRNTSTTGCDYGIVHGCTISYCGNGIYGINQTNMTNAKNHNNWLVDENTIHHMNYTGYYAANDNHFVSFQGGNNNIIEDNLCSYSPGSGMVPYAAAEQEMKNNIWQRNVLFNITDDSHGGTENARGIDYQNANTGHDPDDVTGNRIINNILFNIEKAALRTSSSKPTAGYGFYWANNTCYNYGRGIEIEEFADGDIEANFQNNIFHSGPYTTHHVFHINKSGETRTNIDIDNNLYYEDDGSIIWEWVDTDYTSFATWKANSGQDANSPAVADPQFVNASGNYETYSDFILSGSSPVIDIGDDLSALFTIGIKESSVWPDAVVTGVRITWDLGPYMYTQPDVGGLSFDGMTLK